MALLGSAHVALAAGRSDQTRADAASAQGIARAAGDHLRAAMSGFLLAHCPRGGLAAPRGARRDR